MRICPVGKCDGSGDRVIETNSGTQIVSCECIPPLSVCPRHGINSIVHYGKRCPLCLALDEIVRLNAVIKAYRGAEKSGVQVMNERVTEKTVGVDIPVIESKPMIEKENL